ncbi:hypothetical protein J2T55_002072 [Methylohalomonas lacus]|uniref:Uncharacterized protein n=1 Tax=Methylohalomonas lacus TaxID=398773 RepID=A0AAE3HKR2_9GAMM|nr:hypothetical protein [Methylohalomonas lacus]
MLKITQWTNYSDFGTAHLIVQHAFRNFSLRTPLRIIFYFY